MDTQNTPVHIRLWNRHFWFLALANMLLSMAVYMQVVLLYRTMLDCGMTSFEISGVLGIFGLGIFILGGFCSYLVQLHRRNKVCIYAILAVVLALLFPVVFPWRQFWPAQQVLMAVRLFTGAFFGLAQMVIMSTLVIDTCEAPQRTEANYAEAWFGRFAISLGPLTAILVANHFGHYTATWTSAALAIAALLLVAAVPFPFRTPEDNVRLFSLDRFLMPHAWPLMANLLVITAVLGIVISGELHYAPFFAALMMGFMLALAAEKFVFVNAELMSETVAGLILLGAALLIIISGRITHPVTVPVLVGLGMGLIGSRFLLFFIKLSEHSRRGTSQSSFFISWEAGLAAGLWVGFAFPTRAAAIGLVLTCLALAVYVIFTHRWYLGHKNR